MELQRPAKGHGKTERGNMQGGPLYRCEMQMLGPISRPTGCTDSSAAYVDRSEILETAMM
jgi:hypothetical protein